MGGSCRELRGPWQANAHAHTSWRIEGTIVDSPGKGQAVEIKASSVRLLGATPPDQYPLAKVRPPPPPLDGACFRLCKLSTPNLST